MPVPTGITSLVLHSQLQDVDVSSLAHQVATFLFPEPTWGTAISRRHTDESSLRDVQYLHAHNVRETIFYGAGQCRPDYSAMDMAARLGFLSVVQFLHTHSPHGCRMDAMVDAATFGHLDVVKWLHENRTEGCDTFAITLAAANGHLEIVQYLCEVVQADLTNLAWEGAARNGNLEVVQYLDQFQKNLPKEQKTPEREWTAKVMAEAARNGHLDVVQWLHANRTEGCSDEGFTKAATNGFTGVVVFLYENGLHVGDCEKAIFDAAGCGHLDIIQFLHTHDAQGFTKGTMDFAAQKGHLDIVQFLHENRTEGCTSFAMDSAAENGHLDIVQFLHKNRTEGCTEYAMDDAAANGHLDVVQYLDENRTEGCTSDAMNDAIKYGHLDVIQYLHQHRAEECTADGLQEIDKMDKAVEIGRLDIVQFLHQNGIEGCTTKAMDKAAENGRLDMVQYLHENRTEGCTTNSMDQAAKNGHLDIVLYLHEHRTEGCTSQAMTQAARNGHLDIVQFLHTHRSEGCAPGIVQMCIRSYCVPSSRRASVLRYLYDNKLVPVDHTVLDGIHRGSSIELSTVAYDYYIVGLADAERLRTLSRAVENKAHDTYDGGLELVTYWTSKLQPGEVIESKAMDYAASQGSLKVVKYLHTHGHEGCTTEAMDQAASDWGSLEVVQFLHGHRTEGCTAKAMDGAARHGLLDIVQFLHDNRTEGCTHKALEGAVAGNKLEMAKFLCESRYATVGCVRNALKRARRQDMANYLTTKLPCQCVQCFTTLGLYSSTSSIATAADMETLGHL